MISILDIMMFFHQKREPIKMGIPEEVKDD